MASFRLKLTFLAFAVLTGVTALATPLFQSEPVYYDIGTFLTPNEFDNYLHTDRLANHRFNKPTAVISLGTLRSFNLAAVLRRDFLIALDISPIAGKFNRAIADMIVKYDRPTFLKLLLTLPPDSADISTRAAFAKAAAEVTMQAKANRFRIHGYERFQEILLGTGVNIAMWADAMNKYAASNERWNATFFGNEANYEYLRKMIREERFQIAIASVSGDSTMSQIAKYLSEHGYVVSELDLSNAFTYIMQKERDNGVERLFRNLSALPVENDSRVLTTVMTYEVAVAGRAPGDLPSIPRDWAYLTSKFADYVSHPGIQNPKDFTRATIDDFLKAQCDGDLNGVVP